MVLPNSLIFLQLILKKVKIIIYVDTLTLQIPDAPVSSALPNAGNGTGPMKLSAPRSIDWRLRGVITPIRDQASCGCCWAFASLALAETNLIMKGLASPSVDLSEQYMLKCTP